jgi:ATP-binding cassette subfamily C (CFTR/MRP) protein 1
MDEFEEERYNRVIEAC